MKKLFTLTMLLAATHAANAQTHGAMTFAGKAEFYVTSNDAKMGETAIETDTLVYDGASSSFILPQMTYGNMTIPSFTIEGATQTSAGYAGVTWEDTSFSSTTSEGKTITGSALNGSFTHDGGIYRLKLSVTFNYGTMPMPITYNIDAFYVKPTTKAVKVTVAGAEYVNDAVTYDARLYLEDEQTKLDIAIHGFTLENTAMGDLSLGAYTVKGLVYDEEREAYFRDYTQDGLSFHFTTSGGVDSDYTFTKTGNILVKMDGTNIKYAENNFQPGNMPFPISSTFGEEASTGISTVKPSANQDAEGATYTIGGLRTGSRQRGILVRNGRKYLNR